MAGVAFSVIRRVPFWRLVVSVVERPKHGAQRRFHNASVQKRGFAVCPILFVCFHDVSLDKEFLNRGCGRKESLFFESWICMSVLLSQY